jgi:hypothetical protein
LQAVRDGGRLKDGVVGVRTTEPELEVVVHTSETPI